jgi:hypothetical protein
MYCGITKYYDRKTVGHVSLFFGDMSKRVFGPPLPRDFADLKARIIAAVKKIDAPMLKGVRQEL